MHPGRSQAAYGLAADSRFETQDHPDQYLDFHLIAKISELLGNFVDEKFNIHSRPQFAVLNGALLQIG